MDRLIGNFISSFVSTIENICHQVPNVYFDFSPKISSGSKSLMNYKIIDDKLLSFLTMHILSV